MGQWHFVVDGPQGEQEVMCSDQRNHPALQRLCKPMNLSNCGSYEYFWPQSLGSMPVPIRPFELLRLLGESSAGGSTSSYPGSYPRSYPGTYPGSYLRAYPGSYPGSYPETYPGSYPGSCPRPYLGTYPGSYPGSYPRSYPGCRQCRNYLATCNLSLDLTFLLCCISSVINTSN